MFEDIIQICEQTIEDKKVDLEDVSQLTLDLSEAYLRYKIKPDRELPYGRYLVYQDRKERYHIELHIFSKAYTGSIHCHETWGIFWLLSGLLHVEDFFFDNEILYQARSSLLRKGSALSFYPPQSDWHRVRTPNELEQTLSLHIYGADYDQKRGIYLDEKNQKTKRMRSSFKENNVFMPFLHITSGIPIPK